MDLITPDIGLIFWQAIVFLIVLFVLSKYAWGPITDALKTRETSIEEALASAEQAKEEMAKLKSDNEKLQEETRLERDRILKEAVATAKNIVEESRMEAKKQGDKMIADAKAVIETEKRGALAEVKSQVASLSIQIAEKLLRQRLDNEKAQKELVADFVQDLNFN